jgi:sodium/proline symporter
MLASIVSTATVQVLAAASALSQDIYKIFFNREATSHQITQVTRVATVALAATSAVIAYIVGKGPGIYKLVFFSWSGLGCSFGPIILLSLYSKKINRHGALAAIISGGLAACLLPLITDIPALMISPIISTLCAYGVSYATRR